MTNIQRPYQIGDIYRYTDKPVAGVAFISQHAGTLCQFAEDPNDLDAFYVESVDGKSFLAIRDELVTVTDEEAALFLLAVS